MLLAWAEADPVDDIEIARNEAVMAIQHNRNPFIDFPGLEQYIWGSYSTSYSAYQTTALSISNYVNPYDGSSSGGTATPSISLNKTTASVAVGSTVTLTATLKNASGATVTWTSSNTSVATVSGGTVTGVKAGSATITAKITVSGTTYSATCAVTVTESGSGSSDGDYYVKVTSAPSDWSGTYLIVYESGNVALNGGTPTTTISVSITDNEIPVSTETEAAEVVIAKRSSGYSIKGSSSYLGHTGSGNSLNTSSSDDFANTLSYSSGNVTITCNSRTLKYNSSASLFRFYTSGQQDIQLYKKTSSGSSTTTPIDPTASFATSAKSLTVGDTYTQTVTTNSDGAVTYTSSNTSVATVNSTSGLVTAKAAGTATITATIAATSSYNKATATYTVNVSAAAVPSISVSPTTASVEVGSTTTLTAATENANGATVTWTSSNTSVATVSGGTVTGVKAGTTTITAKITVSGTTYSATSTVTVTEASTPGGDDDGDYYVKVTSTPSDWSGTYLIVYEGGNLAMNGALTADANSNSISVIISDSKIPVTDATEAAEFTIASYSTGYSILAKGGKYIGGNSDKNNVTYDASAILNTVSISSGNVTIVSNSRTLCYRDDSSQSQTRFRYFANASNYNAIQLYKKTSSGSANVTTPGDIVQDGAVNTTDVEALVKILLGTYTEEEAAQWDMDAADVNGQDGITLADLTTLITKIKNAK